MHIHISAICGTFMGGIARLAVALGHRVTGSDANVYPPMSDQLRQLGVELHEGYKAQNLDPEPDLVIIGNALSRGNPEVEAILDQGLDYISGPQWLAEHVLKDRWVIAVAGTHGKTTTSTLVTWILEYAGLNPGFLIGGVPGNFEYSARLGESPFFVVEADEYDTAFFDKRSKFVHYHPRTLVLNNLEFDHADIFPDLQSIKTQFHHLLRTVPRSGLLVVNQEDQNLADVLALGCWSEVEFISTEQRAEPGKKRWSVQAEDTRLAEKFTLETPAGAASHVVWEMHGRHNLMNAMAAVAAARHAGVPPSVATEALAEFKGIKRRMELIGRESGVSVYDDFAHHPTAVQTTLEGLRARVKGQKIYALLEMRSNTMRMGYHKDNIIKALKTADFAVIYIHENRVLKELKDWLEKDQYQRVVVTSSVDEIINALRPMIKPDEHIVVMSNGSFEGIHSRLISMLAS